MDDGHVTKEKFALPASQRKTGLQNFTGEAWYSMKIIEFYRGNLYSIRSSYSFAVALFSNTTMVVFASLFAERLGFENMKKKNGKQQQPWSRQLL